MKTGIYAKSVTAVLLAIGFFTLSGFSQATDSPRKINVAVSKFAYEPSEISMKKGETVVLELTSKDVAHGLRFKDLNLNEKIEKGKTTEMTITPTQTGDFVGHCSVFCGTGHGSMTLTLHVTE
jgi:cytochrome c oxidase subunit 2